MTADERRRGRLKVFLGAAAGVGKTFVMLGELAVNQIVLGESHRPRWKEPVGRSIIARILRGTDGVDVHIIADREGRSDGPQREKP